MNSPQNPPLPQLGNESLQTLIRPGQRIMIWMPSKHMGNLLVALKAIKKLEEFFGASRCFLVLNESYRDIVTAAGLQALPTYFPRNDIKAWHVLERVRRMLAFVRQLRQIRAEIGILIEGDKLSQRLLTLVGGQFAIGPDIDHCIGQVRLHIDLSRHRFHDYATIAEHMTGQQYKPGYPRLKASKAGIARVASLLGRELPFQEKPLVILHPGATKFYKQWPAHFFAAIADDLSDRGFNVVLTGAGKTDGIAIERVLKLCHRPVLSLHNRLSIDELIALCQHALCFVGNDTGPSHLAAATGIPTVTVFGPTDETRWGPLGDNVTLLRSRVACEPDCSRKICSANYRCLSSLTPDQVKRAIDSAMTSGMTIGAAAFRLAACSHDSPSPHP